MDAEPAERTGRMRAGDAVVVGGSMAGLLAARILAEHFQRVVLVERDPFPDGVEHRRGVPQGHHLHALLGRGLRTMASLFPGLEEELVGAGAIAGDIGADGRFFQLGGYKARFRSGVGGMALTRPLLDSVIRRRVLALPGVRVLQSCSVVGMVASADRSRITGVRCRRAGSGVAEELPADLVVDASGRGSRTPAWLEELGYERPDEETIGIGLGYTTRIFHRSPGELQGSVVAVVMDDPATGTRGGGIQAVEDDRWIVTLGGFLGDHPPADDAGFLEFARSLPASDVYDVVRHAEPASAASTYRFPASLRRRYERLGRFPAGLLVLGDALCSFNPLYGQGMSVAAVEAEILGECLDEQAWSDRGARLWRRFFRRAARFVDTPWSLTAGADFAYPGVEGKRPPGIGLINRYMVRVHRAARVDTEVCRTFFEVVHLLRAPSALFRPDVVWRVLRANTGSADGASGGAAAPGVPFRGTSPALAASEPRRGTPPRGSDIVVEGVRSPVLETGPAGAEESVVFVHGNPGSSRDWEDLLERVGELGRAVALDMPGFGRADKPPWFDYTVQGYARHLGGALEELGVQRAHLVLHDFGGPWGLAWAAMHPERFASATLINTGVLLGYRWHYLAKIWRTPGIGELFFATGTRAGVRLALRHGNPRGLPPGYVERVHESFRDPGTRRAVLRLYRASGHPGRAAKALAGALRPLRRPALVVWGRHDPYLPLAQAERQREVFPGAEVVVLQESGHWPFVDDPEGVARAVVPFLREQIGGRARTTAPA